MASLVFRRSIFLNSLLLEALIIFVLILLNGFFSSSEIAIISAKRGHIDKLAKEGNRSAATVVKMREDPDRFLATVQIGVTVVATLASVIGGVAAIRFFKPVFASVPVPFVQRYDELLAVGLVVVVISYATLVLGELVPKSLAIRYSERIACSTARPLDFISRTTHLLVIILTGSTRAVLKVLGVRVLERRAFISEEEIRYFIREGRAKGVFEETEAALLHGVFEFADTTVKEVMVPKHRFSAIEIDTPAQDVMRFISEAGFSRFPVYRENLDKVVGILFNKDVFMAVEQGRPVVVKELVRKAYFVPNSILISKLLREMQRRKLHIAMVVDEHGDVNGLVTIEDIIEEIVGEIEDEYDVGKGGLVEKLRDGTLIIDASISIGDLWDLGIKIEEEEEEEYHTLAGFMLAKLQRIPRGGEFVTYKDWRFTVVDVEMNRIVKVKAEPLAAAKEVSA